MVKFIWSLSILWVFTNCGWIFTIFYRLYTRCAQTRSFRAPAQLVLFVCQPPTQLIQMIGSSASSEIPDHDSDHLNRVCWRRQTFKTSCIEALWDRGSDTPGLEGSTCDEHVFNVSPLFSIKKMCSPTFRNELDSTWEVQLYIKKIIIILIKYETDILLGRTWEQNKREIFFVQQVARWTA